ncbi:MAG: tripartite tricarboxylate transporter substrate binding protein [Proteobacteria bacterium]|nr:tripartite tricarboxylate transporter substrate binding protein [Burkholderiales bacterium]
MTSNLVLAALSLTTTFALVSLPATAQEWPQRPARVLVPFTAGGNTDSIARFAADWLTPRLGQNVVVDNRPGAGGSIAAELVARALPDGYTLFMATPAQFAILPAMTKISYDPVRDFAPISIIGTNPFALGVSNTLPVKSLKEFVEYVKARPGEVPYASAGNGAVSHLSMALFLARAGLKMNHIPYKGGSVAVAEVLGGQVPAYFGNLTEIVPQARAGKLRALAVSGDKRSSQMPDVPTVAEQGFPGFQTITWNGLTAPAKTPAAVINKIAGEIALATRDPAFIKRLDSIGVDPLGNSPAEFAKVIDASIKLWAEAVKVSGAKVE